MSFSRDEAGRGLWWRTAAMPGWSDKANGGVPGHLGMASGRQIVALHEPRSQPGAHPGQLLLVVQGQDAQLHNRCLIFHNRQSHSATKITDWSQ